MAAYQHRAWEEALDRFSRLKELQPNRPGLDALLDEVRWFLQLQAAAPQTALDLPPMDAQAAPASPDSLAERLPARGARLPSRPAWQTWLLIVLGLVGLIALLGIAFQNQLPWARASERELQELYNRGEARLAAGDYEGAQAAFKRLLELSPNNPEAQLGLSRAERQQLLAQVYAAAEAAIAQEEWDAAAAELDKILAMDSSYRDAQAKADFVAQRRRLASLYDDGSRLYDLGQWEEALRQFEKIRELDNTYRAEAVSEFLFVCYLNAGQSLIDNAQGDVAQLQRALEYFSNALAIHPRNRPAADARRLGSLYLDAMRALANGNLAEAQARLEVLLAEVPTYANGQAARQLYTLLINQGDAALRKGNIPAAIEFYRKAQSVPVADHTLAIEGEALARSITPTPTPPPPLPPRPTAPWGELAVLQGTVRTGVLNLRQGPGTNYPVLDQVRSSDTLLITGRNSDGSWLRVCVNPTQREPDCVGGKTGWVASALIEVSGSLATLPVLTPPPPPTATATPTPGRQVVCVAGLVRDVRGSRPLEGWTILLQAASGAAQTQRTDHNGAYRFANLPSGTYTVSEALEPGWRAISPQASTITLAPAEDCLNVDFWNELVGAGGPGPSTPAPTAPPPTPTPAR